MLVSRQSVHFQGGSRSGDIKSFIWRIQEFWRNLEFLSCRILIFLTFLGEAFGNPARITLIIA